MTTIMNMIVVIIMILTVSAITIIIPMTIITTTIVTAIFANVIYDHHSCYLCYSSRHQGPEQKPKTR